MPFINSVRDLIESNCDPSSANQRPMSAEEAERLAKEIDNAAKDSIELARHYTARLAEDVAERVTKAIQEIL